MFPRALLSLSLLFSCASSPALPAPEEDPEIPMPEEVCGNSKVGGDETCDNAGSEEDGCLADCSAEEGHSWELEPNASFDQAGAPLEGLATFHGTIDRPDEEGLNDTDLVAWKNSGSSGVLVRIFSAQGDGPELACDGPAELGLVVIDEEAMTGEVPPVGFLPGSSVGVCAFGQVVAEPGETIYVWIYERYFDAVPASYRVIFAPY